VNFYPFHLGDYAAHTRHLSLMEDLAYRRMLDLYYTTEAPLPADPAKVARLIGMRDHMQEVCDVLSEFFVKSEAGHTSSRCEREIEVYKAKAERAKSANKARWSSKHADDGSNKDLKSDAKSDVKTDPKSDLKSDADQVPTNNQEPLKEEPPIPPKGGDEVKQDSSPKRKAAISLQTYLDDCRKAGIKAIPEGHAVFAYATKVGIPDDFLRLHWYEFKDRYTMPDAKRYKSWATVFHKSVKGNWFRLWYAANDGTYALTTTGLQAQRDHEEAA
jgi:uncharacterized protein YdaU (DUF1376 family)